ncbi:hypothetical protein D9M71_367290 [compost metagenome]
MLGIQLQAAMLFAFAQPGVGHGDFHGAGNLGGIGFHFLEQRADLEAEHARVPEVVACLHVFLGGRKVRLLDEALDLQAAIQRFGAAFDVAEARFGVLGLYAEGDQPAVPGQLDCIADCRRECIGVLDQMVGWKDQHHRFGAMNLLQMDGCRSDGCSSVASKWFQDIAEVAVLAIDGPVLVFRLEEEFPVGDCQYLRHAIQIERTLQRFLQKILPIGQGHEGFGVGFSGDRPKATTGSPTNDHRKEHYYFGPVCSS